MKKTLIMGILNVTDDSFSGDGIIDRQNAITRGEQLIAGGADILDIGGESSRPGSVPISEEEEIARVIPIIEYFAKNSNVTISVDTYKPQVAKLALEAGAHIINDITGLNDSKMATIVSQARAKVVIMHMQGDPRTMQENPHYENVVEEIMDFFEQRIARAQEAGISRDQIILDPGIGFGKTLEHNLEILKNIDVFAKRFSLPVLVGTSRKGFIGTLTGKQDPKERVWGTAASVTAAILNGASIVRVHDVKEMKDVARVADALK